MELPAELITTAGLIGGFAVARTTKRREYGGVVLGLVYGGSFGASHLLAKKIGAWPAVFTVAAITAAASLTARKITADRRPAAG